jgi:hypothetical protein
MEVTCQTCKTGFRVTGNFPPPPGYGPQPLPYAAPAPQPHTGNVYATDSYGRPRQNLGQQMAKASWVAPLIGFALNSCAGGSEASSRFVAAIASFALYLAGLILGIVALCTMRKYGREGVLVGAIVGVCLNALLVVMIAVVIVAVAARR